MASLNKVQIIGRLGKDPEVRYSNDGNAIANVTVATNETWKDKQGQKQEKVEWHRVVIFGKLAEVVEKYLHKGSDVYFEGKLQTRKWQDNNGNDKYSTEVVVDGFKGQMQMLGAKSTGNASAGQQSQATGSQADNFDDDIPF